jgi:hypothetical protein
MTMTRVQSYEQVEVTYRSHNNATASMGGIGQSGESGYRCWRNATGSRDAVKGKRVGLELGRCNRAPLYRIQGPRDSPFGVLLQSGMEATVAVKRLCR